MDAPTTTTAVPTVDEMLADLAFERRRLADAKAYKAHLEDQLHALPDFKRADENQQEAQQRIDELTEQVHTWGISEYARIGSKKPHAAVGIRMTTRMEYDPQAALDWSKTNLLAAVTLDSNFFEAHAKAVQKTQPIPFVAVITEPHATISKDLSAYLAEDIF